MRSLLRESWKFFLLATAAAFAIRLFFFFNYPILGDDGVFYGDLAKNWLKHGILGTSIASSMQPCLVRLPGYPAFLAAIWAIAGVEHYHAVLITQMLIDVGTCLVTADLARRTLRSDRAAKIAFLLAALCPFLANYSACVLTETLAIFAAVVALDLAVRALESGGAGGWAACGAAVGAGILLRPDGGILLPVICAYVILHFLRRPVPCPSPVFQPAQLQHGLRLLAAGPSSFAARLSGGALRAALMAAVALAPLAPWTLRNWRDFHVFEPLAPRYANDPGQVVPLGFQRWVKSWMLDYVSVAEVYWQLEDGDIDLSKAPRRAFDSDQERQATQDVFDRYNSSAHHNWTPDLDSRLDEIAKARIARHPWRYYFVLPAGRILDMWLRPRTEMLGLTDRWWEVANDPHDALIAMALGAINLGFVVAAAGGLALCFRRTGASDSRSEEEPTPGSPSSSASPWLALSFEKVGDRVLAGLQSRYWGLLLAFVVVRSLFLGTLENPEPRYTLECYPVIIVFAAAFLAALRRGTEATGTLVAPPLSLRVFHPATRNTSARRGPRLERQGGNYRTHPPASPEGGGAATKSE